MTRQQIESCPETGAEEESPRAAAPPAPPPPLSPVERGLEQAFSGKGETDIVPALLEDDEAVSETEPASGSQVFFTCPACKAQHPVRRQLAGKRIRCPSCAHIVKVDPNSPAFLGSNSPLKVETADTLDRSAFHNEVWSDHEHARPPEPAAPSPALKKTISENALLDSGSDETARLRRELAEARDGAAAAEEILQQFSRDKIKSEMAFLRRTREAEAQARAVADTLKHRDEENAVRLAGREEELRRLHARLEDVEKRNTELDARASELAAGLKTYETQAQELATRLETKTDDWLNAMALKETEHAAALEALNGKLKEKEDQLATLENKTAKLQALLDTIECNLKSEIDARQLFLANLRVQYGQSA